MGEVVIHTGDGGAGAVVLVDAPMTEVERIRLLGPERNPDARITVTPLGLNSIRVDVAGAEPDTDITVTYDGAPGAHVIGTETNELAATVVAKKQEPTAVPKRRRTHKSTTHKEK